jgi:hypothetical protein
MFRGRKSVWVLADGVFFVGFGTAKKAHGRDTIALKDQLRLLTEQQRQRRSWWRFGK